MVSSLQKLIESWMVRVARSYGIRAWARRGGFWFGGRIDLGSVGAARSRISWRSSSSLVAAEVHQLEPRLLLSATPIITAPTAVNVDQGTSFAFTGGNAIGFSDDAGTEQFSFVVQNGVLNFGSTSGLTVSGNGSSVVFLSGTATAINSAVATLTYLPNSGYSGSDSLSMYVVNSSTNLSTSAAVSITVTPSNTIPTITAPSTVSVFSGRSLAMTGGNAISFGDVAGTEDFSLVVQHGVLNFGSTTDLTVSGNGSSVVFLSGTATAIDSALATLSYMPNSGYLGSDSLGMYVLNSDTNQSTSAATAITVAYLAPPSVSFVSTVNATQGLAFVIPGPTSINDSSGTAEQVNVSVGHGSLSVPATSGVTIDNNNSDSVTLTGSLVDINAALANLQYTSSPTFFGKDILHVTVTDTETNLTGSASIVIKVMPAVAGPTINSPAAVTANHGTFSFNGGNAVSFFDNNRTGSETFSLAVQHGVLNLNSSTLGVPGNHSRVILLSGTADDILAALATLSYTHDNGYSGPDSLGMYVVNAETNQSTSAQIAITVAPTNVAPSIIAPSNIFVFNSEGPFAFNTHPSGDNTIIFSDGAGIENFSFAVQHGQLNFGSTSGLNVSGNGSSVVLMSGTAAAISSALATLVYTPDSGYSGPDSLGMYVLNSTTNLPTSALIAILVNTSADPGG